MRRREMAMQGEGKVQLHVAPHMCLKFQDHTPFARLSTVNTERCDCDCARALHP